MHYIPIFSIIYYLDVVYYTYKMLCYALLYNVIVRLVKIWYDIIYIIYVYTLWYRMIQCVVTWCNMIAYHIYITCIVCPLTLLRHSSSTRSNTIWTGLYNCICSIVPLLCHCHPPHHEGRGVTFLPGEILRTPYLAYIQYLYLSK